MGTKRTEVRSVRDWVYERYSFRSEVLEQECHYGLFRTGSNDKINTTIYLLHGGGADDTQAVQAGLLPLLADALDGLSRRDVQVVLPFIGSSFLHDSPGERSQSFSEYFLKELVPLCGAGTKPEQQFLGGWSMGGQAALNLFLRKPTLFGGAGAHFPTLVQFDFNDLKQSADYARRMKVGGEQMSILVSDFQRVFADAKDFGRHDPLQLARALNAEVLRGKKIYFDVGNLDEFGLSEGALILHDILRQKEVAHNFEVVADGKHDGAFLHAQIAKMIRALLANAK